MNKTQMIGQLVRVAIQDAPIRMSDDDMDRIVYHAEQEARNTDYTVAAMMKFSKHFQAPVIVYHIETDDTHAYLVRNTLYAC